MKRLLIGVFLVCYFAGALSGQGIYSTASFQLINSSNDEQNPVISPDGKTLFVTIRNHPQNVDGKRDPGDIWISTWVEGGWSSPVHGGTLLNNRGYNAVAGISGDGTQLFLLHHFDANGIAKTQGISVSRKKADGWSKPENIFIPYFQNKSSIQSGHLSADGRVLVYSAETYGSYGVDDIYIAQRGSDGRWSEPKNLGPVINTQFQELSPSFSADGKELFFSSNGRRGLGSFDVYTSSRLDDSYTNWSEPVNLGNKINSEGRELYFRVVEQLGMSLYTTTKDSDGYGDIRVILSDKPSIDSVVLVQQNLPDSIPIDEVKPVITDKSSIKVYGRITNSKTGDPIRSRITFESPDISRKVVESVSSGYSISLPGHIKYTVEVESDGYVSLLENIDLQSFELQEVEMNFILQPIEVGTTVNLKNVLFIQSQPELLPESYPELDLVAAFMKANPHIEIELAGHTDNRGSFRQLMELSQKRVNRVKDYLVSKGIDKKRISGKGYGGSRPIAGNDTEEQRMLNRRVEFIIKKL